MEWAGVLQIPPGPYSAKELYTMWCAHQQTAWNHTSAVMLAAATAFSKKPVFPNDVVPKQFRARK